MKKMLAALCAALLLLSGCGGGFDSDSDEAGTLGPGIFGNDTTRR